MNYRVGRESSRLPQRTRDRDSKLNMPTASFLRLLIETNYSSQPCCNCYIIGSTNQPTDWLMPLFALTEAENCISRSSAGCSCSLLTENVQLTGLKAKCNIQPTAFVCLAHYQLATASALLFIAFSQFECPGLSGSYLIRALCSCFLLKISHPQFHSIDSKNKIIINITKI